MDIDTDLTDRRTGIFLGESSVIEDVYRVIDKVAPTDCTVLLTGETGSGKGVIAKLIHAYSTRQHNNFVLVNCASMPESLFEAELFGHTRGAFTGAVRDKTGLFETARGGTVFMDEITNTPYTIQAKLLQVLDEKVMRRVGETETKHVDARLVCASNRDVNEEIKAHRFREDLFYRINVVTINVPPLRERRTDIPPLARYFMRRYCEKNNKQVRDLDTEVDDLFMKYPWKGNIRELDHAMQYAVIMADEDRETIGLRDLERKFIDCSTPEAPKQSRRPVKSKYGAATLRQKLEENGWNVSATAESLHEHRRTIQRLMKRHEIELPIKD